VATDVKRGGKVRQWRGAVRTPAAATGASLSLELPRTRRRLSARAQSTSETRTILGDGLNAGRWSTYNVLHVDMCYFYED
jgi:hypothetical protein